MRLVICSVFIFCGFNAFAQLLNGVEFRELQYQDTETNSLSTTGNDPDN